MHESCIEMRANESALKGRVQEQIQRRIDLQAEVKEAQSELDAWYRAQEEAAALTVRANEVLRRSPPGSADPPSVEPSQADPPSAESSQADPPSAEPSKEADPPSAEPSKEADPPSAEPSKE